MNLKVLERPKVRKQKKLNCFQTIYYTQAVSIATGETREYNFQGGTAENIRNHRGAIQEESLPGGSDGSTNYYNVKVELFR